jgi:hypothetical protein
MRDTSGRSAYHEAGHGCIAIACQVPVSFVSIEDVWRPDAIGVIETAVTFGQMDSEALVLFSLAGGVAEQRHLACERTQLGDAGDLNIVRLLVSSDCMLEDITAGCRVQQVPRTSDRVTAVVDVWRGRAERLVDQNWNWIVCVAEALEQRRRLSGAEIEVMRPHAEQVTEQ